MARDFQRIEKGVHQVDENGFVGVHRLHGTGTPGSSTETNDAEAGSLYQNTAGELWLKHTAGSGTDKWTKILTAQDQAANIWYVNSVRVATTTAAPSEGGTLDLTNTGFDDDDSPDLDGNDFTLGDYVLFDCDGTPEMARVSAITLTGGGGSDHILTFTKDAGHATYPVEAMDAGDMLSVEINLPDSPNAQETYAVIQYDGSTCNKVADLNWELATGISLSGTYGAACGDIAAADTVEAAIQKLDGHGDALDSALGVTQCDTDMGTYTGDLLNDNESAKQNIQQLETYIEGNRLERSENDAVTDTAEMLDEVLVDDFCGASWKVCYHLDSAPAQKQWLTIDGFHDGTASADAANVKDNARDKMKFGADFTSSVYVDIDGSGATQKMRLMVAGGSGAAVSFSATRIDVKTP